MNSIKMTDRQRARALLSAINHLRKAQEYIDNSAGTLTFLHDMSHDIHCFTVELEDSANFFRTQSCENPYR
jgi:hypothetical protein